MGRAFLRSPSQDPGRPSPRKGKAVGGGNFQAYLPWARSHLPAAWGESCLAQGFKLRSAASSRP